MEGGVWSVRNLIKELFDLSNNFKEYLHSRVTLSLKDENNTERRELEKCTFKPILNPNS